MKQRVIPGGELDMLTSHELHGMLKRDIRITRIREPASFQLDPNGNSLGPHDIYKVPIGAEFEVRRININISDAINANLAASSHSLSAALSWLMYLRSGTFIEYGQPTNPTTSLARVPGVQTWGDQQGPYLRNGEMFQIDCAFGTAPIAANAIVSVTLEGILTENRQGA